MGFWGTLIGGTLGWTLGGPLGAMLGAAVPYLTEELYPALASLVDRTVLVPDEDTLAASRELLLTQKLVTEPSGALATAGARMTPIGERGLSVALLTGASVGAAGIRRLLSA